jgi:nicotinate phosphoribosyltransferase
MAHSFIQAYDDEAEAFESFARARSEKLIFLIDTYDTEAAARKVVELAPRLEARGIEIGGVRLDSGDLGKLSKSVRRILDEGGLGRATIFASGGLDEDDLLAFARAGVPVDGFGIGTSLAASTDAPALDCAYKLVEYAGIGRRKRSSGKASWPGRKQVWRSSGSEERMAGDVVSLLDDVHPGAPLLEPVMRGGERLAPSPDLGAVRARAAEELARLPEPLRGLEPGFRYPVAIADSVRSLADEIDHRMTEGTRP